MTKVFGFLPSKKTLKALNAKPVKSWYCEPCAVEVYERRCPHCGKLERERT